jgi:rod shape-determining protein MreC
MSILDWLARIFSFGRGILSLVGAVAFCSVLLNLSKSGKQTFHDVVVSTFLYPAQVSLSIVNRSVEVFSEHEALKSENAAFRVELDLMRQKLGAFPRQGVQDAWADSVSWRLKKASVVAEQPSRFATTWVINVGSNDSVDVNMPVLTSRGIVGKVVKSFGNHSMVQLTTDPRQGHFGVLEARPFGREVSRRFRN